jgi:DNA-binding CsgD family transcriptional regulator
VRSPPETFSVDLDLIGPVGGVSKPWDPIISGAAKARRASLVLSSPMESSGAKGVLQEGPPPIRMWKGQAEVEPRPGTHRLEPNEKPRMTPTASLIGRKTELAALESFVTQAAGLGGALVLFGEPGSGKSALLDAVGGCAEENGIRTIWVTGVEFEAAISYSALNQCFLPLGNDFRLLSDAHRSALTVALGLDQGPAPDALLVSNAALALLQASSRTNPICLIIDNLQWVDRSSAVIFGLLARRLLGTRIGLLASSRTGAECFFDCSGLPSRVLESMNDDDAGKLLALHYPTLAQRPMRRILQESAGNPLALIELPRELSEAQRLGRQELPPVLQLGQRLQSIFESRVDDLPPRTRRLIMLAVLDGTADLRRLQGLDPSSPIADDLAPAERAHMVKVDDRSHRVIFRHPLIRSAVYGLSTTSERQEGHRALAEIFDDQPDRQAWHLAEATLEPDARVSRLLYESAQRTFRRGDTVGAVGILTQAADLSPHKSHQSRLLLESAYLRAAVMGDLTSSSQLYDEALKGDPGLSGSLSAAATGAYLLLNGDTPVHTVYRLLSDAIEARDAVVHEHDESCVQAVATLFLVCSFGACPDWWESFHSALERLGPIVPEELFLLGKVMPDPVRLQPGIVDRLDQAIGGLDEDTHPWNISVLTSAAIYVDRFSACRSGVRRVIEMGSQGGGGVAAINVTQHFSRDEFLTGNWKHSQQLAEEALVLCQANDDLHMRWLSYDRLALVAAGQGDVAACTEFVEMIVQWATPRGAKEALLAAEHAKGLLALGLGHYDSAYLHFSTINPPGVFLSHNPRALSVASELVEACVRTNRLPEARSHVAAMQEANLASLSPRLNLVATACAAMTAPDETVIELFERALGIAGADCWQFEYARVQCIYGERLRRMRSVSESRRHLNDAFDTFTHIGAEPWAMRAETELRATGRSRERRHSFGLDSLTAQEREIAGLAAAGMSNKEIGERLFLSHRTVGAHLYRVFPKLEIRNRAALRDALGPLATTRPD